MPNWEEPYKVVGTPRSGTYQLATMSGKEIKKHLVCCTFEKVLSISVEISLQQLLSGLDE